jgi:hypothetical protein
LAALSIKRKVVFIEQADVGSIRKGYLDNLAR